MLQFLDLWVAEELALQDYAEPGTTMLSAVVTLLVLAVTWLLYRKWTTLDLLNIPAPPGIPVIGHILQMAKHIANGHERFLKWHEAYGSLVRIRLLHRDIVLVADPQVASELLLKGPNECPRRTPEYTTFNVAHGMQGLSAILTEQDEERWKAIRRAIAPAYTLSAVRDLFPTIVNCYAEVCERIASGTAIHHTSTSIISSSSNNSSVNQHLQHQEVRIDEEVFAATINLLAEGFLQMQRQGLFDAHEAAAAAGSLVAITNTFISQPWKQWLYLGIPGLCKESRAFHEQRQHLMSVTGQIASHVLAHRASTLTPAGSALASSKAAATATTDTTLAGCLAKAVDPSTGRPLSREALQAEAFLQIVGQESIPWTTAWTLFLLTQHSEAEAAVLKELRAVGVPCNGDLEAAKAAISMDLLKQLPYCTAVINEAMRLFPAGVAASPRMTDKVTKVGQYKVPAGVIVFPCLYSILMYSGNWDHPQKFQPDRWLNDPSYAIHPATGAPRFVPFGIGPKACVAQHLAMVQCKVLLVLLVSCFSWELGPRMGGPEGVLSQTVAALELRVAQGMWLVPMPRATSP